MIRPALLAALLLGIGGGDPECGAQGLRFAWLSDTHVGSTTGEGDLRASVRDLNGQPDIQFVLFSGDITEWGTDAQLQLVRSILDSLRHPYYVIPGNHDEKWSESGGRTFLSLFGSDRFAFRAGGFQFIGMHQGPRMRMGDGYWAPEDVRWLDSLLQTLTDRGEQILFVAHYPLDSGIANWYEVLDRLKERNTQVVLVGHGHRNRAESYEGIPGVMGRSNLRGVKGEGGYTIVWQDRDSLRFAERDVMSHASTAWHAVGLRKHFTPLPALNWPRPSFTINAEYPRVRKEWNFDAGSTIGAGATFGDGLLFFGGADGRVTCLERDSGKPLWSQRTGGAVYSTPGYWNGHVVVGSCDSTIRSFRGGDGAEEWLVRAGGPVLGPPAIEDGIAYIGASDRRVRAIDIATGTILWVADPFGGFIEAKPLVYRGRVVVGAWDESLYALDAQTGKRLWSWKGSPGVLLSPAACWPVGTDGRVFVVAPDRKMTALDLETGKVIWRSGAHQVRETIGLSGDGGRVFVRLMRDTIMAFSAVDTVERALWATPCGFGYDINSAMIVEKEGVLFYASKDGMLVALESRSGRVLWKHRVAVGVVNTVLPLSKDRVVTTGFDGVVRMLFAGGEE